VQISTGEDLHHGYAVVYKYCNTATNRVWVLVGIANGHGGSFVPSPGEQCPKPKAPAAGLDR
jgi:hypothetical protein